MTREIEALETLDEFHDDSYGAYLEYVALKDQCVGEPSILYLNEKHEFFSEYDYYAKTDGLDVKITTDETKIC